MTTDAKLFGLPRSWTLLAMPFLCIGLARLAAGTPLAAQYPRAAALLLVWIIADSLMLSLMTRIGPARLDRRTALAVLAGAMASAALVMPPPLRAALLSMPVVTALMAAILAAHLLWGAARARRAFARAPGPFSMRFADALAEVIPPPIARLVVAEARLLHLALFQWRARPDVPARSIGFGYHKHLVPIFSVILFLQVAEIGVVHLLVSIWSRTAALILFALSVAALVYLIGLLKSFRLRPVLVDDRQLRVRAGILVDRSVPLSDIADVRTTFSSEEVKRAGTVEAALFAWPNILVSLKRPMPDPGLFRPFRTMDAIAFRLDDPEAFVALIGTRLERARQ